MLDKILALINKPRLGTSADYRKSLDELDIAGAEQALANLEGQRQQLLLKAGTDAEIAELDTRIRVAQLSVERRYAAKGQLEPLLERAIAAEKVAGIEAKAKNARDVVRKRMVKRYVELHAAATQVAELLQEIESDRQEIQEVNRLVSAEQRPDLKVESPLYLLAAKTGLQPTHFPQIGFWALQGYTTPWREDRRFDRMSELL